MLDRILKLAKEPSTFAGIAGFLGGISLFGIAEDLWMQIFGAIAAIAGVLAAFLLDPGRESEE